MSDKLIILRQNLDNLIAEVEESDVKDFTYNLVLLAWSEICGVPDPEIDESTVESMLLEIEQSIEIMNPELKLDLKTLEELAKYITLYSESE